MRRILHARLLATALVVSAIPFVTAAIPAYAQDYDSVGFESFQQQLAPYGYWLYSDRWGVVWQPADVPDDFRPYYSSGRWVNTEDYGWTWASDYAWGDIPFHYGRWVNDPEDGWLWMPGYTWSPGWVIWRTNDRYIGWMPMPPDENFLGGRSEFGVGISFGRGSAGFSYGRAGFGDIGGFYGYSRWYGRAYDENLFAANWVFVGAGHLDDHDYRSFAVAGPQVIDIIHQTHNVTNYTVVNNYVVNRSVNVGLVERASGHPVPFVRANAIFRHPNFVTSIDVGQRVQVQMRQTAPRGMGIPHSAPPPPPVVVGRLSEHVAPHNGRPPSANLMTRAVVSSPAATVKFRAGGEPGGRPEGGPTNDMMRAQPGMAPPGSGPNSMMGPGGEPPPPHHSRPAGAPTAGNPDSMTGPGSETSPPHHAHPEATSPSGSSDSMTGPGSETAQPHHSHPAGAPAESGTDSMSGPQTPPSHHTRPQSESTPPSESGSMSGPGTETPTPHHAHPTGAPPAGSDSMSGPGTEPTRHSHPSSENTPTGESANPPPAHTHPTPPKPAATAPDGSTPPPPHKKKEPNPEGSPPPQ